MAVPPPRLRADVLALTAMALNATRMDPTRRPVDSLVSWHRRLSGRAQVLPRHPRTNRELLDCALRLGAICAERPEESARAA